MAVFKDEKIRNHDDLERFETKMTLDQRLPERSILDVFTASAEQHSTSTAITMLMSGAEDEQPRRVTYSQLLVMIRGASRAIDYMSRGVAARLLLQTSTL